jgi:hypothetical protein
MDEGEPLRVPVGVFGGTRFWSRLNQLATERGHGEHTRWLVGEAERTDRYRLMCQQCDAAVVEMLVDRTAATG